MEQNPTQPESEMIACEVCLKEIPRDLASASESAEYVHHFCGEACYEKWKASKPKPAGS